MQPEHGAGHKQQISKQHLETNTMIYIPGMPKFPSTSDITAELKEDFLGIVALNRK